MYPATEPKGNRNLCINHWLQNWVPLSISLSAIVRIFHRPIYLCNEWTLARHFPANWPLHRLILLAENVIKPLQKRMKTSKLNLDFINIHSIVITLLTPFLKCQITITVQFFVTTNLPTTCEKFVNISIFFYSWGAIEKLFQKLVQSGFMRLSSVFSSLETLHDETLAIVFEIVRDRFIQVNCTELCRYFWEVVRSRTVIYRVTAIYIPVRRFDGIFLLL